MTKQTVLSAAFGAMLAAAAGCSTLERNVAPATLSVADQQFVAEAAHANLAEIEAGDLAQENGGAAEVRELGRRMVREHTEANEELRLLASRNGYELPDDTDLVHQAVEKKLSKLGGAAFDRAYTAQMVKDHEATLAKLERAARDLDNAQLRAWAARAAQHVRMHLDRGEQVAATVGAAASGVGSGAAPAPAAPAESR